MNKINLKINWATYESAKYACLNWHYSGVIPVGKLVKIGAWEDGKFIGVVLFGRGANKHLGNPYGLEQTECVELVRIALNRHKIPVSKIVSIAMKFLVKSNPKLKLVVSYADQSQGHHGGIYQAGNWIYTGAGKPDNFYMIKGKLTHPRTLASKKVKQNIYGAKKLDAHAYVVEVAGKHRYLMALDKDIKNDIIKLSKPYPKRVKQAMNDAQS